jgi:subtilisin family serine protease
MPEPRSWEDRVQYSPTGQFAYRPGEVLVPVIGRRHEEMDEAIRQIQERFGSAEREEREPVGDHELWRGDFDVPLVVEELRALRFSAQPNHVLFSDGCDCGPCAPWWHPAAFYGSPFTGNALGGLPFTGNPFGGLPFTGNPFGGLPFTGNPYPDPTSPGIRGSLYARTGRGRNLARPAPQPPERPRPKSSGKPEVAVLDTPLPDRAAGTLPGLLAECHVGLPGMAVLPAQLGVPTGAGVPDEDQDRYLDRIAGHGIFVAGRIASIAPACSLRVIGVLANVGDGDEYTVAAALEALVGKADIVNLSMGGYALDGMACLASAVRRLQTTPSPASAGRSDDPREDQGAVVVASAGNEATCRAPFPAGLPGVVSVAALGPNGPAPFTNYGPWVRACAAGVDVTSAFFKNFDGAEPPGPTGDPDRFDGGAIWSGTSFSAPVVAGRLARLVAEGGLLPKQAVRRLIDAPGLAALPGLGTIVTD